MLGGGVSLWDPWREDRSLDDADLVRRAREGDVGAYEDLVRRHQGVALRAAHLASAGGGDAEDAVQTAFVKAYGALHRFDPGRPFRPWLLRIVTNEARNRARSEARRARWELAAAEDQTVGERRTAASAEAEALVHHRREALLREVNALRSRDRTVIAYRYFLGLSEDEAARALGWARGTVKSRLHRALNRLGERLREAGVDVEGVMDA